MAAINVNSIAIRMYRIGTGDCLALKFFSNDKVIFKLLIDCGSCQGDSYLFESYVKEINEYFNNELDLLVISHEHSDHIIGFSRAIKEFQKLTIKNVWLAWTEDPTNKFAKKLKKEYGLKLKALALTIQNMTNSLLDPGYRSAFTEDYDSSQIIGGKISLLNGLTELMGLHCDTDDLGLVAAQGDGKMAEAMNFIKKKKQGKHILYCYPGKAVPKFSGLNGINFYILGPPENEALLKKDEIKEEVYERKLSFDEDLDYVYSVTNSTLNTSDSAIFSEEFLLKDSEKNNFEKKYLTSNEEKWRNIDLDWLGAGGKLALRLQRYMNNTSLAFAIEFVKSGKVLLFPGDAQSGNWMSWHDPNINWKIKSGKTTKTITAKDLLRRTVFYKVGHHLSHNGTASKSGLELMLDDELIAFAPLDYNNILSGWKKTMPAPGLMETLIKKTRGRIFRIDDGLINNDEAKLEREKMEPKEAEQFEKSFSITDKFIEFRISG